MNLVHQHESLLIPQTTTHDYENDKKQEGSLSWQTHASLHVRPTRSMTVMTLLSFCYVVRGCGCIVSVIATTERCRLQCAFHMLHYTTSVEWMWKQTSSSNHHITLSDETGTGMRHCYLLQARLLFSSIPNKLLQIHKTTMELDPRLKAGCPAGRMIMIEPFLMSVMVERMLNMTVCVFVEISKIFAT